jgi:hypothetical protein
MLAPAIQLLDAESRLSRSFWQEERPFMKSKARHRIMGGTRTPWMDIEFGWYPDQ